MKTHLSLFLFVASIAIAAACGKDNSFGGDGSRTTYAGTVPTASSPDSLIYFDVSAPALTVNSEVSLHLSSDKDTWQELNFGSVDLANKTIHVGGLPSSYGGWYYRIWVDN